MGRRQAGADRRFLAPGAARTTTPAGARACDNREVTTRSRYWLVAVSAALILDLAFTVHTALTWKHVANGPTIMPAGELLGWFVAPVLIAWIVLILIGALRAPRPRGWVDPGRQDRMAPHKPVNIRRTRP